MLHTKFKPNGFRTTKLDRCALLGALLLATACGADGSPTSDETPSVYVGSVEETDAKIALVRDGARWAAYLCGGAETLDSTAWFKGERGTGKRADAIAAAGDHDLHASFTAEDATGVAAAGLDLKHRRASASPRKRGQIRHCEAASGALRGLGR
jgi:hypothetical protein